MPQSVTIAVLARTLFVARAGELVPLGAALPEPSWLPVGDLQRALNVAARRIGGTSQSYSVPPGRLDLRRQLAKRATRWGGRFGPEDILVTAGETQAMQLALRVTCKQGDIIAVESPCYFGMLLLLESMGLQSLELPTDPLHGLDLESMERALRRHRVAAVLMSPTAQNPTGATMLVVAKRRLVQVLPKSRIPLMQGIR